MIFRKNIIKFWVYFVLVLAVALGAITLVYRWQRIFPSKEVSELYRRYANTEGIEVSYVKNYRINDTIYLNVTMIDVKDTSLWEGVCEDLHLLTLARIPEELRAEYLSDTNCFESHVEKDTVVENGLSHCLRTVYIYSRYYKNICVFHSVNEDEYTAIMYKSTDDLSD